METWTCRHGNLDMDKEALPGRDGRGGMELKYHGILTFYENKTNRKRKNGRPDDFS
jgi:hypothetical protein